jgi:hypothetical protein
MNATNTKTSKTIYEMIEDHYIESQNIKVKSTKDVRISPNVRLRLEQVGKDLRLVFKVESDFQGGSFCIPDSEGQVTDESVTVRTDSKVQLRVEYL